MIYVVHEYDMIFFVGINWQKARDAAIKEDVPIIDVWEHGEYSYSLDLDRKRVEWPLSDHTTSIWFKD